jgi:hypothetical protein
LASPAKFGDFCPNDWISGSFLFWEVRAFGFGGWVGVIENPTLLVLRSGALECLVVGQVARQTA